MSVIGDVVMNSVGMAAELIFFAVFSFFCIIFTLKHMDLS